MKLKKFEWLIIVALILALFGIAWAVDEKLTVSYTTKTLTSSSYGNATRAILSVEGADIKITLDGVTLPTSAGTGVILKKDAVYTDILTSKTAIANFKAVRTSGGVDATINVSYQRPERIQ